MSMIQHTRHLSSIYYTLIIPCIHHINFLGKNLSLLCSTATDACAEARNQLLEDFSGHAASDGPVPNPRCKASMGLRRVVSADSAQ